MQNQEKIMLLKIDMQQGLISEKLKMWFLGYTPCGFCGTLDTSTENKFAAIVSIHY